MTWVNRAHRTALASVLTFCVIAPNIVPYTPTGGITWGEVFALVAIMMIIERAINIVVAWGCDVREALKGEQS